MASDLWKVQVDFGDLARFESASIPQLYKIDARATAMLNAIGYEVQADAIELIQHGPARHGVFYKRGGKQSRRSAKGEPAKSDTGRLASSVFVAILGGGDEVQVGYLEAIAPYGKYLEDTDEYDLDRKVLEPAAIMNTAFIEQQKNKFAQDVIRNFLKA